MKPLKLNDARKVLIDSNCVCLRQGEHEIWKNNRGIIFSLPSGHRVVSPGVLRKLFKFIERI